jgi:hypothetical protein
LVLSSDGAEIVVPLEGRQEEGVGGVAGDRRLKRRALRHGRSAGPSVVKSCSIDDSFALP